MQRWGFSVSLVAALVLVGSVDLVRADAKPERTAILAVELGSGVQEFMRGKTSARSQDGLIAAGFEVISYDEVKAKLPANLASCREGSCLKQVGEALGVTSLLVTSLKRKDESTIIVFKLLDAMSGDVIAEIHEVCDLCGQDELEERIGVASSALRMKAGAERLKRANRGRVTTGAPSATGKIRVGIIPSVVVNLDAARVDALTQELAEALSQELDVQAVGGLEVRRQLPADGLAADCVTTPLCTADVAKRLNADQLLFIVMVGTGNALQVDTTWIEPISGQTATRAPFDVANMNEAKPRFIAVAKQLLPDAAVRSKLGPNPNFGGKMSPEVPRHFTTPAKITAAIGVVGLGLGIGLGIRTSSRYGDCEKAPGSCDQSAKDSIRNSGLAADAGFLVAIAAGIATGVLFATSGESAHLIVAPSTEAGNPGASVVFSGRF